MRQKRPQTVVEARGRGRALASTRAASTARLAERQQARNRTVIARPVCRARCVEVLDKGASGDIVLDKGVSRNIVLDKGVGGDVVPDERRLRRWGRRSHGGCGGHGALLRVCRNNGENESEKVEPELARGAAGASEDARGGRRHAHRSRSATEGRSWSRPARPCTAWTGR